MNEQKTLVIFILVSIVVLGLGIVFVTKTQPQELKKSEAAMIEVMDEMEHDWGEIDIFGGTVEKVFQIKNSGTGDLTVTNFITSCMCTEARVLINGGRSPIFGMHSRSGWSVTIEPGQTADVEVVFDPMAHGPDAVGPITRFVSFETNDLNNQKVELKVSGEVIKQ